jgi:DNA modification methylase
VTLYQGDCLWMMHAIPDASVDLVLCDLPYGTTQNKWDSVISLEPLWAQYKRVCKGAIVLTAAQPFTSALVMSNLREFRYEWIWEKTAATGFLSAQKNPLKAHENIAVFYKTNPVFNPQKTLGHRIKRSAGVTSHGDNYGLPSSSYKEYDSSERYPRSVQIFAKDNRIGSQHPTQKPVALMEYLIRTYTDEGMTVLDNCMGSGTTGVACVNTNREFIGIERDPNYFKIARERIEDAQFQNALREAERLSA